MKIGIEIPLYPKIPEPELTTSPLAGDDWSDNLSGLFYRVEVEALEEWANITNFMMGGLGLSVEEPEITSNFCDFFLIMYRKIWEKAKSPPHHNEYRAVKSSNTRLLQTYQLSKVTVGGAIR